MLTRGARWRALALALAALALWTAASVPTGLPVHQVVVFTAPGALLGIGAGWAASAAAPQRWTWRAAALAAVVGALLLAPVLAFLIALDGQARPHGLVAGFVRASWLAFAAGLAVAVARAARVRSEQRAKQARR